MSPTFTLAISADADLIVGLMREFYASEQLPFDEAVARAGLGQLFADPRSATVYLVRVDGALAGYFVVGWNFSLEFGGRYAWIDELYVRETFRGRGVGAAALAFVGAECRRLGVRAVRLEVQRENPRAREWYLRSGYGDAGRSLLTKWVDR